MSAASGLGRPAATDLPARSRGRLVLVAQRCTSCLACARACPNWCIEVEAHTEISPPAASRGRPRSHHVLDRFAVDVGACMHCGLCVEVCSFDSLHWVPQYPSAATDRKNLRHERDLFSARAPDALPEPSPVAADPGSGNTGSGRGR